MRSEWLAKAVRYVRREVLLKTVRCVRKEQPEKHARRKTVRLIRRETAERAALHVRRREPEKTVLQKEDRPALTGMHRAADRPEREETAGKAVPQERREAAVLQEKAEKAVRHVRIVSAREDVPLGRTVPVKADRPVLITGEKEAREADVTAISASADGIRDRADREATAVRIPAGMTESLLDPL